MASLPNFAKFDVFSEERSAGKRWRTWISKLENLMCALNINSDARKKALLLHYAGDDVFELYESFTEEQKGVGAVRDGNVPDEYNTLKKSLTDYFTPKQNSAYETFKFRQSKQQDGESVDTFYTRLRSLASGCDFHDVDKEILAQIIQGCNSTRVRRKALKDNMTLQAVLDEARALELSDSRAAEIEQVCDTTSVNAIRGGYKPRNGRGRSHGGNNTGRSSGFHGSGGAPPGRGRGGQLHRGSSHSGGPSAGSRCRYCGYALPHYNSCPARGKECQKCFKKGHFARVCESSSHHKVRHIASKHAYDDVNDDQGTFSDEAENVFTISSRYPTKSPVVKARIFNTPVTFIVDTGATVNILDSKTCTKVCPDVKLHGPCPPIFAYGMNSPLPVKGYFTTDIKFKTHCRKATFYVVDSDKSNHNLLSSPTAQELHMIQFAFSTSTTKLPLITEKYSSLFDSGLGKIKDITIKLHVDETISPVVQRHRRIPFNVRKDVERELERLEAMDIIEKVDGPTPWVSPIVVVPKKSGGVRVCVDMREANKAIKREKHPMPTLDDLISDLNGSTVFSKLDLTNAYHQLELDKESRYITTFTTHVGLRRYKRLLFGVNAASEIFQNAIAEILHDIPGVKNLSDDIIIHGKTQDAHDRSLQATLKRLSEKGARLQKDKCVFSVSELTFFGHVFGKKGIRPDPEKIKTIHDTSAPSSVAELRSFLGMCQYVSRFIPGYATTTAPLRDLTKKDTTWKWENKEQQAFNKLKQMLTGAQVMAYFDPSKPTEVIVDASPTGLGAILTQNGKVICYASRALTPTEQRYSQTDREFLAVVHGVEHFHLYLFGSRFQVTTDHKPLIGIMNSQKPTTARMERWRLRLMPYEMDLVYAPGRDDRNPADYISRHPQNTPRRENAGEEYIRYIAKNSVPKSMTLEEVKTATQSDQILQKVMVAVQTGKWNDQDIESFAHFRDELSVHDGLVLRDHRLVVPSSLRHKAVNIAHQSHLGIVKTKQCIREKIWFPGIDRLVEDSVKACIPCQASYPGPKTREPIIPTTLPSEPWSSLAIDFAGPFPSGDYLMVVIDEHSRFPEVEIIPSTAASVVLPRLETIFSRQGIPKTIKSDNGPPFHGQDFANFAHEFGFRHGKITPLWPEANGTAERFMASLNKNIRASSAANLNWKTELQTFLRLYRATPHVSTGISPFEALTGRKMNIGLPSPITPPIPTQFNTYIAHNDAVSKQKMSAYADQRRHTKPSRLQPGDHVLVRQPKKNKLSTPFSPSPYIVTQKKGSMVTAKRGKNTIIVRNSSFFKPIQGVLSRPTPIDEEEEEKDDPVQPQQLPDPAAVQTPRAPSTQPRPLMSTPAQTFRKSLPTPLQMSTPTPTPDVPIVARPARQRKPPAYLLDYETS